MPAVSLPVRVAVAVVFADKVLLASLFTGLDLQRLVNRVEQVFGQVGKKGDQGGQVLFCVLGRQTTHQVESAV